MIHQWEGDRGLRQDFRALEKRVLELENLVKQLANTSTVTEEFKATDLADAAVILTFKNGIVTSFRLE